MALARRVLVALLAVAALSAAPALAVAGEPTAQELADARRTFNEGKDLEKAGNYAGALEKFKKVAEVRITPQVRFHIALCEENLGKLVSALKGFELAAEEAKQAGSSAIEVAENAPARAAALRKRVAHLTIQVKGHVVTSKLTLDGVTLPREKFGVEQPVDPGTHRVLLETEGAPVFDKDLELAERASQTISVEVHDADPTGPAGPGGEPGVTQPPPGPSRVPAYVVAGFGVAMLAGGGVLMGLSQNDRAFVHANCPTDHNCPNYLKTTGDRGSLFYTSSLIVGGVGVAAVVTGAVLFVALAPKKPPPKTGASGVSLQLRPSLGGAVLVGSF